ncbi:MAG: RcnB family protein [Pseudomonadota bacterium]
MIKKALIFAVTAASLATGASAFAQSDYRTDGNERYQRYDRDGRSDRHSGYTRDNRYDNSSRDYRNHRGDRYSRSDRGYRDGYVQHNDNRYYRAPQVQYGYSNQTYGNQQYYRGVRPHQWQRGMHLSNEYRTNRYVVSDWRRHRGLYAPQYGHQWVQNGNDYLLVAIASGLIASVLLGN